MFLGIDIGVRNLSYCVLRRDGSLAHWQLVDLLERGGYGTIEALKLDEVHDLVHLIAPELFDGLDVAHVGIERQPHKKPRGRGNGMSLKIWLFSHLLFSYFRERLWSAANLVARQPLLTVQFVDPKRKYSTQWMRQFCPQADMVRHVKEHAVRKRHSVEICRGLLAARSDDVAPESDESEHETSTEEEPPEASDVKKRKASRQPARPSRRQKRHDWLAWFDSCHKRDDLADAFLMATLVRTDVQGAA